MAPLRQYSPAERRWRLGLTAVLAVYGWVLLRSPGSYTWLDSLDLAIHGVPRRRPRLLRRDRRGLDARRRLSAGTGETSDAAADGGTRAMKGVGR
jgi:hypothetical protein